MKRAAVVETKTCINRQTISERYRVTDERRSCNRRATDVGGRAGDGLGRRSVGIDIPDASRNKAARSVLAPFELPSDFQLVVTSERGWTVMTERRFRRHTRDLQLDQALRSPAGDA